MFEQHVRTVWKCILHCSISTVGKQLWRNKFNMILLSYRAIKQNPTEQESSPKQNQITRQHSKDRQGQKKLEESHHSGFFPKETWVASGKNLGFFHRFMAAIIAAADLIRYGWKFHPMFQKGLVYTSQVAKAIKDRMTITPEWPTNQHDSWAVVRLILPTVMSYIMQKSTRTKRNIHN